MESYTIENSGCLISFLIEEKSNTVDKSEVYTSVVEMTSTVTLASPAGDENAFEPTDDTSTSGKSSQI